MWWQCDLDQGGKVSMGVSIIVRVTLKDGTYHEVSSDALFHLI
jgi:recombination DNA repair RAD52 pathway protein